MNYYADELRAITERWGEILSQKQDQAGFLLSFVAIFILVEAIYFLVWKTGATK